MSQPSTAYRQHHDVEAPRVDASAFRQGWRVVTRLDALASEGAIDAAIYAAAVEFRLAWEIALGRCGAPPLMEMRTGGRRSPDGAMMSRLDALAALRLVADSLGAFDCKLLEACVILDQPWAVTGRQHAVADTTARRWTIAALARLAAQPR